MQTYILLPFYHICLLHNWNLKKFQYFELHIHLPSKHLILVSSVINFYFNSDLKIILNSRRAMSTVMEMSTTRAEIRSVLVKHWRSLDKARLHTIHLWLLLYAAAQIFIEYYFSEVYAVLMLEADDRPQSKENHEKVGNII